MILKHNQDGSIVAIDHLTGRSIKITCSEIQDFRTDSQDEYTKEWRSKIREELTPCALSEFSICLIISGRFDHNKKALQSHLKRVNREEYLERIWSLL